mmetsp:Transcript_6457/g.5783  ORF Transcript_6457/g.5783 Transcript_6457/m.5783 type:complete len:193 (-) Transcript_6457:169-747(-)
MYQYRKVNDGHGITGAKNIYSSNVKIGNWNEDMIGDYLSNQNRTINKDYLYTEQMKSYCPYDERTNPFTPPLNSPKQDEKIIKNNEGIPYKLIFNHGKEELAPNVRFTTTFVESYGHGKTSEFTKTYALPDGSKQNDKYLQIKRDHNLSNIQTTSSRAATAHADMSRDIVLSRKISTDLPNWKRRSTLKHRR